LTENVYELHYLKTKWYDIEVNNPFVLDDKLQLMNVDPEDGDRIVKHLARGLRDQGLAIQKEVLQIRDMKCNNETTKID